MKHDGATVWSCWLPRKRRMRIGLISDTHVPQVADAPPHPVAQAFRGVDLILHAGDIYTPDCLDWLEQIAPVRAVEMGGSIHFAEDHRVAHKQVVEVNGFAIGIVHDLRLPGIIGDPSPAALRSAFPTPEAMKASLQISFGRPVDIVVFGHTHEALLAQHQGVLFVNPGAPFVSRQRPDLGTVAILELTPRGPSARVLDLGAMS